MICDLGDVVIVPFPFVDRADSKRRPSAVLSNRTFNTAHGHSICAMITTAKSLNWPSDIVISDLTKAGLPQPCVMRWKVFTLPNEIILRKAGTLSSADRDEILRGAREFLN